MRYVALLRGISPADPNMRSKKLQLFFESLGFTNVRTVIGSGNVVFDTPPKSVEAIEKNIETEMPKKLGFSRAAIVRSRSELEKLAKRNPFKGIKDEKPNYLIVTFFKSPRKELCTVVNINETNGPKLMQELEKKHGKSITTRTWKTVHRILSKMEALD